MSYYKVSFETEAAEYDVEAARRRGMPVVEITAEAEADDEITDIYTAAVSAMPAEDIDHHATDLYLRITPISTALVNRYKFRANVQRFTAADGSGTWYDIPFAYSPAWAARLRRTQDAE